MELRQLELFRAIADAGSMNAASRSIPMAQPNISYQMKRLEEELGVSLFERSRSGITLTPAGKILYQRADTILGLSESAKQEVVAAGHSRSLRLGITPSICPAAMSVIRSFSQKFPDVRFEIHDGITYNLVEEIKAGVIDLALIRTPVNLEGLESFPIRREPMVAASCLEKKKNPFSGKDLSEYDSIPLTYLKGKPLIFYRRYDALYKKAFQEAGFSPDVLCWCDDSRTSMTWAKNGLGYAIYPSSMCQMDDGLYYQKIDCGYLETKILLVKEKGKSLPAVAKDFASYIHSLFPSIPTA